MFRCCFFGCQTCGNNNCVFNNSGENGAICFDPKVFVFQNGGLWGLVACARSPQVRVVVCVCAVVLCVVLVVLSLLCVVVFSAGSVWYISLCFALL